MKNGSAIVKKLNEAKVQELYDSQRRHYLDNIKFEKQIQAANELKRFFNNREITSKDLEKRMNLELFDERPLEAKLNQIKFVEGNRLTANQKFDKIKKDYKTITNAVKFIQELTDELHLLDAEIQKVMGGSKKVTNLISKLENIKKEVKKGTRGADTLNGIAKGLQGSISNFNGEVLEYLVYQYVDDNSERALATLFPSAKFKKITTQATGSNQIAGIGGYDRATRQLSTLRSTDVRDVSVSINADGIAINVGISVKNYNLKKNSGNVSVKLRDSSFNQITSRLSGLVKTENPDINKLMGPDMLKQATELIHTYKYVGSDKRSSINNLIPNIDRLVIPYKQLFALILYDTMVSQGDFLKYGTQILFLNNRALTLEESLPTMPKDVSIRGFTSRQLISVATEEPAYSSKVDSLNYLMRYASLSLSLHQKIALR